jgi:methylglutaconyl-CoA hydratase
MTDTKITLVIDPRGVATVTLNNEEKHNAFDDAMICELTQVFEQVASNNNVRVMVLSANGKSFSAGADLNWMKRVSHYAYKENLADASALATMLKTLNTLPKPTIARVQGAAFGGAVGLVSCCDIAIASPHASFCLSEVKIGLIPATISPYVIAAIGSRAARRYFNTAETFTAATAMSLGLVSEVVDAEQLDSSINTLVDALLRNSPAALKASKQLIFDIAGREINTGLIQETSKRIAAIRVSPEGQEGLSAFLEKRPAEWVQ